MRCPRNLCWVVLPFLFAGCTTSTTDPVVPAVPKVITKADRIKIAKAAGEVAAYGYLIIEKPDADQVKAVRDVVDLIRSNLLEYKEGGFKKCLPGIDDGIDKLYPLDTKKAQNLLAKKLASILVGELDNLFDKHADWKKLGKEVADINAAFCEGAIKGFDEYIG